MMRAGRKRLASILLLLLLWPIAGMGQEVEGKILIPLVAQDEIAGRHGSKWITRLAILNQSNRLISVFGYDQGCGVTTCIPELTPPQITFYPRLQVFSREVQGVFLRVPREDAKDLRFTLLVKDLSQQSDSWGVEIPVIRESMLFEQKINLLDIPGGHDFRRTLRIYDFDSRSDARVTIRFFEVLGSRATPFPPVGMPAIADRLLTETSEDFRVATTGSHPGYIELNLDQAPLLAAVDRVRIEIEPLTEGLRYWAFVVTNNQTQDVTTVTPQ